MYAQRESPRFLRVCTERERERERERETERCLGV